MQSAYNIISPQDKVTKLMTNISVYYYNFIDEISKSRNTSKRNILEEIINSYMQSLSIKKKKEDLSKSFQRANLDKEILEMADEGMSDYFELTNK